MFKKMFLLPLSLGLMLAAPLFAADGDDFVKVQIKGQLQNRDEGRLFVESSGQAYRLDIGDSANLRRFALRHNRESVVVFGSLFLERSGDGSIKRLEVVTNHIESANASSEFAEREVVVIQEQPRTVVVQDPPVREVIVRERREPLIKVGPLEIGR